MKKTIIFSVALVFLMMSAAHAGTKTKKNCGCGLGSMLFEDSSDGLASQTVAATTNGIFGNQTFGITSGTLGCEKFSKIAMKEKLNIFVADNMDRVATDIASGQGESLDAIADLAKVPVSKREMLYTMLQNNFDSIYTDTQVTHKDVVQKISEIIENI